MGKYDALTVSLLERPGSDVVIAFDELGETVGGLPVTARTYSEWSANRVSSKSA